MESVALTMPTNAYDLPLIMSALTTPEFRASTVTSLAAVIVVSSKMYARTFWYFISPEGVT